MRCFDGAKYLGCERKQQHHDKAVSDISAAVGGKMKSKVKNQKAKDRKVIGGRWLVAGPLFTVLFLLFTVHCSLITVRAQTSEFTYQGRLVDGSLAANGTYEMRFRLFDAETDGTQQPQPTPITLDFTVAGNNPVSVTNGVFTVKLDFTSAAFPGAARFLEISVRRNAIDPFTQLNPRQPVTSAPQTLRSLSSSSSDGLSIVCVLCVTDAHIQSIDGGKVTGTVASATTAVNISGIVPIANGGTGSSVKNFVDLSTTQTINGHKTFGNVTFVNPNNPIEIQGSLNVGGTVFADQFYGGGDGLFNVAGTLPWQPVSGLSQQAVRNSGYVATNDGQVTITLPANPGIGDIVRVSGAGFGGWRIAQNDGQSIIGLTIASIGGTWTPRESSRGWFSVASSADGSKLVAVAYPGQIYTSTDSGVNWIPRESSRDWISVASSTDGTKLVALAEHGQIYTSTDSGQNWAPRETNRGWFSVASSADGSKLIAVVAGGQIYTSTDSGLTWTPRFITAVWVSVASSADGTKLVALESGGRIYTSPDSGITWVPRESNRFWRSVASSANGNKLVAVVNAGQIYTSTNSGANWTPRESNANWNSVASSADGTRLVATVAGGQIYISTNSGVNWLPKESSRGWFGVASSAEGTKLVAIVNPGQIYTSTLNTNVGTAGYMTGDQFSAIELQYIGNGRFLPLSYSGTISAH